MKVCLSLQIASERGHVEVVTELLAYPQINVTKARSTDGVTPLFLAARNGHLEVVKELLAQPKINANQGRSTNGATPLILCLKMDTGKWLRSSLHIHSCLVRFI